MRRLFFLSAVLILFLLPCEAAELQMPAVEEFWAESEREGVPPGTSLEEGFSDLWTAAKGQLRGITRDLTSTGTRLMAVVLLCAIARETGPEGKTEGLQAVELAGALALTALTMTDLDSMIGLGRDTILRMDRFSQVLLPAVAVLTAATGNVTAAAARQGATMLFSQLLLTAMDKVLIPALYACVALSCACAAVGNPGLQKVAGCLKGMVTFLLSALLLAFVGYLTASGAIAGSVDASAVKAAKLAITRMVPVVGGILADASETVLAGAGVLQSSVGAAGLVVVCAISLTPFLHLALHYLLYKGIAALCSMVAQPRLGALLDAIGGVFGLVLGMTGAAALVLLISVISALKAVLP